MAQSLTDLKTGRLVKIGEEPYLIVSNSFMRKAQRKPVMRTKLRGVISGKVIDKTYIAGEDFDLVNIEKTRAQYMYKDADSAYFMESLTFEQFSLPIDSIDYAMDYLKEGEDIFISKYEGRPISVDVPPKVVLKVIETSPGVKGDTATGGTKQATLETGKVINVPLFIVEGENVRINTETGMYVERAE